MSRVWLVGLKRLVAIVALSACAAPAPPSAPVIEHARCAPAEPGAAMPASHVAHGAACPVAPHEPSAAPAPRPGERLSLPLDRDRMALGPGRWVVLVSAPPRHYVSIGLTGPVDALDQFAVVPPDAMRQLRAGAAKDDGRLPAFVSFESADHELSVPVVVDVTAPVELMRVATPTQHDGDKPLVGLPYPLEERAGYFLDAPTRYLFVRSDVAEALRAAFHQTRVRYKGNAIGVGDTTQWNGVRPATDLGKPRHISHDGGVDIDIGLPSSDGSPSGLTRRCQGVLVDEDRLECAPGTVRNLDVMRLTYLLGLLIDGPTPGGRHIPDAKRRPGPIAQVDSILTDQVYIDEIRKALPKLRAKRWIHEEAYGALGEEGILRPSPWHTDHVHVRFAGKRARVPELLRFDTVAGK